MFKLPSWFAAPKKTLSAADLASKLQEAEKDHVDARARIEEAKAALRAARSEGALEAQRVAKRAAEDIEAMIEILRDDHQAATEREHQEHLAQVRVQRDAARDKRSEHIARETEATNATALALLQGWVTLHRERETELKAAFAADHEARRLSAELGEQEPAFRLSGVPSDIALAEAIEKIGAAMPGPDQALLYSLVSAVAPGYRRITSLRHGVETSERLAEQSRQRNRENPPQPSELVYIDPHRRAQGERPSMGVQISNLLKGDAG